MKVKTLLAQAAKCTTQVEALALLDALKNAFCATTALSGLPSANDEADLEEAGPYVSFELNHVISDHYITMVRPEIREGKLVVQLTTNHMLDGLGLSSQSWEVEGDMDDLIEPDEEATIAGIAALAKKAAIADHAELIERVGVARELAFKTARKSW